MSKLLKDLRENELTKSCFAFGDKHHVTIQNSGFKIQHLKEYLEQKGHTSIEIEFIEPDIEDCFMELSQR